MKDDSIDYGYGITNIDHKTGIRYGIISQHNVADWIYDELIPVYPEPENPDDTIDDFTEPLYFEIENSEYSIRLNESGEIIITKSPYFTMSQLCSPCFPGAGNLDCPGAYRTYCLGPEYFDDDYHPLPYDVYAVIDDTLIKESNDDK